MGVNFFYKEPDGKYFKPFLPGLDSNTDTEPNGHGYTNRQEVIYSPQARVYVTLPHLEILQSLDIEEMTGKEVRI